MPDTIEVWTDGACSLNRGGVGGWAWATTHGWQASGAQRGTTNQRMEMFAVIMALEELPLVAPVHVFSDSAYVINCHLDRWHANWTQRGSAWFKRNGDSVANSDLWTRMFDAVKRREQCAGDEDAVTWQHVRGHSQLPMNELVDKLAVAAKHELLERLGL